MRKRTIPEMLRDSHAGSVIVAKFIAEAIGVVLASFTHPLASLEIRFADWLVQHAFRDVAGFSGGMPIDMFAWLIIPAMISSVVLLAIAYVISGWIYAPSPVRRSFQKRLQPLTPSP